MNPICTYLSFCSLTITITALITSLLVLLQIRKYLLTSVLFRCTLQDKYKSIALQTGAFSKRKVAHILLTIREMIPKHTYRLKCMILLLCTFAQRPTAREHVLLFCMFIVKIKCVEKCVITIFSYVLWCNRVLKVRK